MEISYVFRDNNQLHGPVTSQHISSDKCMLYCPTKWQLPECMYDATEGYALGRTTSMVVFLSTLLLLM